ncbi:MAG: hypothetical protein ACWGPR_08515 [Candidatus Deferrimicrobiaceae bacterium]
MAALLALCACGSGGDEATPSTSDEPDAGTLGDPGGDGDGDSGGPGDGDVGDGDKAMVVDVMDPPMGGDGDSTRDDAGVPPGAGQDAGQAPDAGSSDAGPADAGGDAGPPPCPDSDHDDICDADDPYPNGGSADDLDGDGVVNDLDPCPTRDDPCDELIATFTIEPQAIRFQVELPTKVIARLQFEGGPDYAEIDDVQAIGLYESRLDGIGYDPVSQLRGWAFAEAPSGQLTGVGSDDQSVDLTPFTPTRAVFYLETFELRDCDVDACSQQAGVYATFRWEAVVGGRWELRGTKK